VIILIIIFIFSYASYNPTRWPESSWCSFIPCCCGFMAHQNNIQAMLSYQMLIGGSPKSETFLFMVSIFFIIAVIQIMIWFFNDLIEPFQEMFISYISFLFIKWDAFEIYWFLCFYSFVCWLDDIRVGIDH
jgi:hypothetical protein